MTLVVAVLLLGAAGAILTSLALRALEPLWGGAMVRLEPERRARWLSAMLASPPIGGVLAIVLGFGPCLLTGLRGKPDDCFTHGEPGFTLCLQMNGPPGALALALAVMSLVPIGLRIARIARATQMTRTQLRSLRSLGKWDDQLSAWIVPGWLAAAGTARRDVYLGEDLLSRIDRDTLAIVVAHEQAHVERRDVIRKITARLASALHVPSFARGLLDALDLAIEQACDAAAARRIDDPVRVARALVDLARLPQTAPAMAIGLSAADRLEARVLALCAPSWRVDRILVRLVAATVLVILLAFVFDRVVHETFEALIASIWH